MVRNDFSAIAQRYERDSVAQRAAAEILFDLAAIGAGEDVLDLGCGTGHHARRIRALTTGRVVGLDPSPGMIAAARAAHGPAGIEFAVRPAEEVAFDAAFDVVFCNSALHWFEDTARALAACRRALRPGGRMAMQAPARQDYCPNFVEAARAAQRDPRTAATFAHWRNPWRFLETAEEYAALFRDAGFEVALARMDALRSENALDEAMAIFESGAAAGYLDAAHYGVPLPDGYLDAFRAIVRESLAQRAGPEGKVGLAFRRVFVVATRPG